MRRFLCGTPMNDCCGSMLVSPNGGVKGHSSPVEAFKCYRKYLIRQGYKMTSNNTLEPPDGGPIKMLGKPSHFGAAVRQGKKGDDAGMGGKRIAYINADNRSGGTLVKH